MAPWPPKPPPEPSPRNDSQRRPGARPRAGAPQPSATLLRSYDDLRAALADYCDLIGMSRSELDAAAGLSDGNSAKALAKRTRKRLAWKTLQWVLGALGLALQLVRDTAPEARMPTASSDASSRTNRRANHWRNRKGAAWGRQMAFKRALALSAERRREIARKAAQARHQRRQQAAPTPTDDF